VDGEEYPVMRETDILAVPGNLDKDKAINLILNYDQILPVEVYADASQGTEVRG